MVVGGCSGGWWMLWWVLDVAVLFGVWGSLWWSWWCSRGSWSPLGCGFSDCDGFGS